jgi:hypothetical protein
MKKRFVIYGLAGWIAETVVYGIRVPAQRGFDNAYMDLYMDVSDIWAYDIS